MSSDEEIDKKLWLSKSAEGLENRAENKIKKNRDNIIRTYILVLWSVGLILCSKKF